jgi:hypothetical protein
MGRCEAAAVLGFEQQCTVRECTRRTQQCVVSHVLEPRGKQDVWLASFFSGKYPQFAVSERERKLFLWYHTRFIGKRDGSHDSRFRAQQLLWLYSIVVLAARKSHQL